MQTNTRILAHDFIYLEAGSLDEVLSWLQQYKTRARLFAGGTDVLVKMKLGEFQGDYLINIKGIKDLDYICCSEGLRIGAATTLSSLERSTAVARDYRALHEAVQAMAAVAIRNMATIGGNICNAAPAADTVPPLLAFGARVELVSSAGKRVLPLEDFITGVEKTALAPDEILVAIELPAVNAETVSTFVKLGRVSVDKARISLAVVLELDRTARRISAARVALGAVGPKAFRCPAVEEMFRGCPWEEASAGRLAEALAAEIKKSIPGRYSLPYKKEAVHDLAYRALGALLE